MKKVLVISLVLLLSAACVNAAPGRADASKKQCPLCQLVKNPTTQKVVGLAALAVGTEEVAHKRFGLSRRDASILGIGTAAGVAVVTKGCCWVASKFGKKDAPAAGTSQEAGIALLVGGKGNKQ